MNKEIIQAFYASLYASLNSFMALDIASTYSRDNVIMRKGMPTTTAFLRCCTWTESRKKTPHSFHIVKFEKKSQNSNSTIVHATKNYSIQQMNLYQLYIIGLHIHVLQNYVKSFQDRLLAFFLIKIKVKTYTIDYTK